MPPSFGIPARGASSIQGGRRSPAGRLLLLLFLAFVLSTAPGVEAVTGQAWVLRTRSDFGDARLERITLSPEGRLSLSPEVTRLAETEQAFLWCLAVDPKGRVHVGGGNEGQVLRVSSSGAEVVFDAPEVEVHAIAFDAAGRLFAASSPEGRIYRVSDGSAGEVFFDPNAIYIWAMAFDKAGNLIVATGQPGQVLRVGPSGRSEVLLDAREDHIRTLVPDGQDGFYAGSDGSGIVYRIGADGKTSVLNDTRAREIAAMAVMDGDVYAAALAPAPQAGPGGEGRGPVTRVRVTAEGSSEVQDEPEGQQEGAQRQARPQPQETFGGAVYRISPRGYAKKIWEARDALPLSLLPMPDGRLLMGTGDRGRMIALSPDGDAGEIASLEASQVNALIGAAGGNVVAATSNLGAVFEISRRYAREGTAVGSVRDAGFTSRWGALTWDADVPAGTELAFEVRTGDTETPDGTWSDWSKPVAAPGSVIDRPAARFLQWRATLRSKGDLTPALRAIQVHYLPENMPPAVDSIEVLAPGVSLQPSGAAGGGDEGGEGAQRRASQPKRAFQRGMRAISWKAGDANGDALRADVLYRAEDETAWKTLKAGVEDDFFSWDSTAMPDGVYRVRVVASDALANPPGRGLTGQRDSAPFDVDNTPPSIADVKSRLASRAAEVTAVASDSFSVIGEIAYAVDASEWTIILPEDGVADSSREVIRFTTKELPPGEHSIVVRARDRAGNVSSGKVIVRVP